MEIFNVDPSIFFSMENINPFSKNYLNFHKRQVSNVFNILFCNLLFYT